MGKIGRITEVLQVIVCQSFMMYLLPLYDTIKPINYLKVISLPYDNRETAAKKCLNVDDCQNSY
jgi:hypothetical protein